MKMKMNLKNKEEKPNVIKEKSEEKEGKKRTKRNRLWKKKKGRDKTEGR